MKTRRWPVLGVVLAVLWLFVRGVALDPTRWLAEFLIGLAFGLPVAFLLRRFYTERIDLTAALRSIPFAVVYLLLFFRELLTANIEVAYRVLAPSMPIEPDVIEVPLRVESDLAITTIANSITLTPGTLTMDYDDETNTIYVHAIAGQNREAVVEPIRIWEDYALRIFEEDRDPSDPAPPVPSATVAADGPEGTDGTDRTDGSDPPIGDGPGGESGD